MTKKMKRTLTMDDPTCVRNYILGLNPNVDQDLRYRIVDGKPIIEVWRYA